MFQSNVRSMYALVSAAPLLHLLEMKFVVISYDGDISFPEGIRSQEVQVHSSKSRKRDIVAVKGRNNQ